MHGQSAQALLSVCVSTYLRQPDEDTIFSLSRMPKVEVARHIASVSTSR